MVVVDPCPWHRELSELSFLFAEADIVVRLIYSGKDLNLLISL